MELFILIGILIAIASFFIGLAAGAIFVKNSYTEHDVFVQRPIEMPDDKIHDLLFKELKILMISKKIINWESDKNTKTAKIKFYTDEYDKE